MILYLPFLFQGIIMTFDEFYFHEKRGLPRWEIIGHPLDTLTTALTLSIPIFFEYSVSSELGFIIFATFSCLFITKDEFVHADHCSKSENWTHAILFILHPITFMATYFIWKNYPENIFLKVQFVLVTLFMFYQIIRWSSLWKALQK